MDSSRQMVSHKRKGRPPGVPNTTASANLSLAPRSKFLRSLIKVSPFIEKSDQKYTGRKLKNEDDPLSEQEILSEDAEIIEQTRAKFLRLIPYLTSHGIMPEHIAICPAYYYPTVSAIPVLYVYVRKEKRAIIRLRNQANRCGLHCYLESGDIPRQDRSLLYPEENKEGYAEVS